MTISIIVPTLNEADTIALTLRSARAAVGDCELIVVDAESVDDTAAVARQAGARVLTAVGCRAEAMNVGAAQARGEVLLFLHADTSLPLGAGELVRAALETAVGGAFRIGFDEPKRVIEMLANFRSRHLGIIYGDQAIFARRTTFNRIGGYRPIPIMEDCDFVRRLRQVGSVKLVALAVTTSARRHRSGTGRTLMRVWLIQLLYHLGVSPTRLAEMYPPIRSRAHPDGLDADRRSP